MGFGRQDQVRQVREKQGWGARGKVRCKTNRWSKLLRFIIPNVRMNWLESASYSAYIDEAVRP